MVEGAQEEDEEMVLGVEVAGRPLQTGVLAGALGGATTGGWKGDGVA